MVRHYRVIFRELVINTLPSHTSILNAAVGNTIYNQDAQQAKICHYYKNARLKLLKTNATILFNKICHILIVNRITNSCV
jgi:hypothetical protein